MAEARQDIARTTLAVAFIALLTAASLWTLQPFMGAGIWATMIVVATWPLMLRLQRSFRDRRAPAVIVMCLLLLLVIVVPFTFAIGTVADNAGRVTAWIGKIEATGLPTAPAWIDRLPVVGEKLSAEWNELAEAGPGGVAPTIQPYAAKAAQWLLSVAGNVGGALIQFLAMVVIAAIIYAKGEVAAGGVRAFARRLAGERGPEMVTLAGQSIRAVALGIVVTALLQALGAAIGLAIAGVPFAAALALLAFVLCIVQLGPLLVLIPSVIWVYSTGRTGMAIFLGIVTLIVGTVDNFIRPYLIKKGADLPFLLILPGVIGGLLSFGLLGIFIGPVVLAVTYTLLQAWIRGDATAT